MGNSIEDMVNLLESQKVDALGMNCGYGPELYENLVLKLDTKLPILIQPNAGLPEMTDGKAHYSMTAADFAKSMAKISQKANLLGGCCGTTPEHIKEMIAICRH
jgi:5-methyltetrahydrofolate--homocysteine methyltransferase